MTKVVQPLTSFFPVQELDLATPKPWRRFVPAWLRSLIWVDSIEKYDAFLSYSWKSDGKVAPVIQSVIQKFLCPWYRFRAKSISVTYRLFPQARASKQNFVTVSIAQCTSLSWLPPRLRPVKECNLRRGIGSANHEAARCSS